MRSGWNSRMAARAAAAAKEASRYSIPFSPRRSRAAANASGSRSIPKTRAPSPSSTAAWPPPPSVASTARVLPPAHSRTAAERTGTWYGMEPEAAVGTLQHKKTPRRDGAGVSKSTVLRAGLTGLEPATSGVTDRHSNQLSYSPKPLAERRNIDRGSGQFNGESHRRRALEGLLHLRLGGLVLPHEAEHLIRRRRVYAPAQLQRRLGARQPFEDVARPRAPRAALQFGHFLIGAVQRQYRRQAIPEAGVDAHLVLRTERIGRILRCDHLQQRVEPRVRPVVRPRLRELGTGRQHHDRAREALGGIGGCQSGAQIGFRRVHLLDKRRTP